MMYSGTARRVVSLVSQPVCETRASETETLQHGSCKNKEAWRGERTAEEPGSDEDHGMEMEMELGKARGSES